MRVFSNKISYTITSRYDLNNVAKSLWNDRTAKQRRKVYGDWVDLYTYEPEISQAELCILTYQWPFYVANDRLGEAQAEVDATRQHGKPMVVFSGSDYTANLPFEDVILFESAGYRSTPGLRYHSAQPSYIPDYLDVYCDGKLQIRHKQETPLIGFCGLASTSPIQTFYRKLRLKQQQILYRQGRLKREPPPFETSSFRTRVLRQFEDQPGIKTNYILRKKYRGGETEDKSLQSPVKLEFVNNILDSDYTLCMRGGGNFSVRFYETLCLGRIPIFIDTDCLLPFQDEIDYKAIFPWIDIKDLHHAPEILRAYHANLSADDFIDKQKACRKLWEDHMTPDGFHQDFINKIKKILNENPVYNS